MNSLNDETVSEHKKAPITLGEALRCVRLLLTAKDIQLMKDEPLHVVIARLHLTLGYQVRGEFGLWREESSSLLDAIADAVSDYPVFDADSASIALIALL